MKHEELGAYYESILDKEVRKEGGVYYTPPFIVEYMVANTVGELLKDKTPEEMAKLTIVDPACGGGVFLLGAYQYLLDWHEKHCGKLTLTQRQKILMNNIFGVDIDPLAVEITKYSLSMTCSEGKDFSLDLDQNIRCGNSLIDTEEFDWKKDFSRIFKQGGFNIVIGNPPYVEAKKLKKIAVNLKHYDVHSGTADLSVYFLERGLNLLKNKGLLMFITTNKFFNTEYGKLVRKKILKHQIRNMMDFEQVRVFESTLVSSVIIGIENCAPYYDEFRYQKFYKLNNREFKALFAEKHTMGSYKQSLLGTNEWSFADAARRALKNKIEKAGKKLSKLSGVAVYRGVTTGYNPAFIIDENKKNELIAADPNSVKIIKPLLQGRNIRKWVHNGIKCFLLQTGYDTDIKKTYPAVFKHLRQFQKELKVRDDQGKNWFNLRACRYYSEFEKPEKIIWGLTADKWAYAYDDGRHYLPSNGYILTSKKIPIKYLLGLLNSTLLKFYFGFIGIMTAGGAFTLKYATVAQFPIVVADDPQPMIAIVDTILAAKQADPAADTSALERKIDALVYKLYGLTDEEIPDDV